MKILEGIRKLGTHMGDYRCNDGSVPNRQVVCLREEGKVGECTKVKYGVDVLVGIGDDGIGLCGKCFEWLNLTLLRSSVSLDKPNCV